MEVLYGPRPPGLMETNTRWCLSECLDQVQSCLGPWTRHLKQVKATNIIGNAEKNPSTQRPLGQFILDYMSSGSHPVHNTKHAAVIPVSLI